MTVLCLSQRRPSSTAALVLALALPALPAGAQPGAPSPAVIASAPAPATPPPMPPLTAAWLQSRLDARFQGDRTGACVVAAVIAPGQVLRGRTCAQPRDGGGPGYDSTFEIGSVTKTMTAALVADLVRQGRWTLDDPIAAHLPPGTPVPRQGDRQILVRDVLTHTSGLPGLPPGFAPRHPDDPYAELTEPALLAALGQVQLTRPIGSQFEYSNFAMMVLSAAVARSTGGDFEATLVGRLLAPLKMDGAFVTHPRGPRPAATGHLPSGRPTSDWHVATNLAGVGMVRATLDDMIRYVQGHLGQADPDLRATLALTREPLDAHTAMNWMRLQLPGREIVAHEGATGGFSSLVVIEPKAGRAVVILADTSLGDLGGLGSLGSALLGIDMEPLRPRRAVPASEEQLAGMPGDYDLGGMHVKIWRDGARLMAQADGQAAFALEHDSEGDFYPEGFSALLSPQWEDGRMVHALWRQLGGITEVTRQGLPAPRAADAAAADPRWQPLQGEYALAPQFHLRVFVDHGRLQVQGSGQPPIEATLTGPDTIEIKAVGAVVEFKRDAAGQVRSAVLRQGGQVIEGPRVAPAPAATRSPQG